MRNRIVSLLAASTFIAASLLAGASASARPGGWGGSPGWRDGPGDRLRPGGAPARDRSREARIEVNRFVGDNPGALGHGGITVASQARGDGYMPQENRAAFEAAVIDQLVRAGYDTAQAQGGQLAELTITRTVVEPAEQRREPVSGAAEVGFGTGGSHYGLALAVDLSKPLPPLVSTRLAARIRDRATNAVLWEGRAQVATREGAEGWSEQATAARLAAALFDGFPRPSDAARGR